MPEVGTPPPHNSEKTHGMMASIINNNNNPLKDEEWIYLIGNLETRDDRKRESITKENNPAKKKSDQYKVDVHAIRRSPTPIRDERIPLIISRYSATMSYAGKQGTPITGTSPTQ